MIWIDISQKKCPSNGKQACEKDFDSPNTNKNHKRYLTSVRIDIIKMKKTASTDEDIDEKPFINY